MSGSMESNAALPLDEMVRRSLNGRREKETKRRGLGRLLRDALITCAVVYLLFGVVFGLAVVDGASMGPRVTDRSLALFLRLDRDPQPGDVVIFTASGGDSYLIKRVAAVGGDVVDIDEESGVLLLNGAAESTPWPTGETHRVGEIIEYPFEVPVESMFVLGDNREEALDSRQLGAINVRRLTGRVLFELKLP